MKCVISTYVAKFQCIENFEVTREIGKYDKETHEEHVSPEEYRHRVKKLFCQPHKTKVDVILNKDG